MALDVEGFDQKVTGGVVSLAVNETHPLIKLCNVLPWQQLLEIILPDLKKTNKLLWWIGRPLRLRIHLGIYLLQKIYDLKDREAEAYLRDNAAFRLFCGFGILKKWHVPDHTKIEEFRSKLLPETQRQIANLFAVHAVRLGYANPKNLDIDSTVQKANISYPSTTNLLIKTSLIAKRLINALTTVGGKSKAAYKVNLKQIKDMALNCFNSRGDSSYKEKLQLLWREVFTAVLPILKDSYVLENKIKAGKYWKVRRALEQLHLRGALFLNKVHQEIFEGVKQNRIIHSLHAYAVHTFRKSKIKKQFKHGRAYQLGRIEGNFLYVGKCTSLRMSDAQSFPEMIAEHEFLFGENELTSVAADKGYYARDNEILLENKNIREIGICRPNRNLDAPPSKLLAEQMQKLRNRRAGIEALIGHIKQIGQMRRSRMKLDSSTLSVGYGSVLGFNLRQLMRHLMEIVCTKKTNNSLVFSDNNGVILTSV